MLNKLFVVILGLLMLSVPAVAAEQPWCCYGFDGELIDHLRPGVGCFDLVQEEWNCPGYWSYADGETWYPESLCVLCNPGYGYGYGDDGDKDDGGVSWSNDRYFIPVRAMAIDRNNPYNGSVKFFWGVGKPIAW